MTLRAVIVDDEPLAQMRIKRLLVEAGGIDVVAVGENGKEAISLVAEYEPDLLFLDIQMPIMNGLQAAYDIAQRNSPPAIIFCTAYNEFTLEAFKTNAVGYLLKPIKRTELLNAIENSAKVTKAQLTSLTSGDLASNDSENGLVGQIENNSSVSGNAEVPVNQKTLLIQTQNNMERWPVDAFLYFRVEGKCVVAGLREGGEMVVDYTLKSLERDLADVFVRVHRQSLVNCGELSRLFRDENGQTCVQINGVELPFPVSRRHLGEVKQCFIKN